MKRINEILKLIKYFKKNISNRSVYESVAFSTCAFVVVIHFFNVIFNFDVVVVGFLWAIFAKVLTGLLFIYRRLIWYMEISELTEPSSIDFSLVGVTFETSIKIGKIIFIGTGAGAAIGLISISVVGYELIKVRTALKKVNEELATLIRENEQLKKDTQEKSVASGVKYTDWWSSEK
jgi:hypothetical protein